MSEVKRYQADWHGMFLDLPGRRMGTEERLVVLASDFDRVTAERDAALETVVLKHRDMVEAQTAVTGWARKFDALQVLLTAADERADERADVLEGLLRDSKDVMSGIWDTSYDHEAGDALSALDLMERIDAALKPAEGGGDA